MPYKESAMSTVPFSKITIRQPRRLKAKIEKAAALRGMTVTSFINGVLERVADRTIERVEARDLSERDSKALLSLLMNPPKPNSALKQAAKKYWIKPRG